MDLVSASQINQWNDCERKWGWKYIAKIPQPDTFASALGTEVDDTQLQPYLRDDRPLDFSRPSGYIAAAGLAFLPKPKTMDLEVQKHFVIPSPTDARFGFQGYLDLWLPHGGPDAPPPPTPGLVIPNVRDFKTTGNWKYAKTPKQLETDVQAQLYATWAMWTTGARIVDLDWIYFATKGAYKSRRVHLRVTGDHVAEQFSKINDTAVVMYAARKSVTNPLELKANPSMCEAYGGCPYRDKCNLSPGEVVDAQAAQWARKVETSIMGDEAAAGGTMSLVARMNAQKAAARAGAAGAVQPPPVSPATGQPAERPTTAAGIPVENLPAWATADVDPRRANAVGINPPESALPPAPPVGSVQAPPSKLQPSIDPNADVGQIAADRGVATVEPVKRRGPGRPRKAPVDPLGADAALHTTKAPTIDELVAEGHDVPSAAVEPWTCETVTHPEFTASFPLVGDALLESVAVTWAEETLCPVAFNPFKVGPFEAKGFVRKGESISQASARIYAELVSFAEAARTAKAVSFAATLNAIGGRR
jgi:hypothetical protein